MEQNTNSNIPNNVLLEILLEHPDFSDFERKGGAECFPKKNATQICGDYTSNTNQGLRCSLHRPQEPAPNCRSLLCDGGQNLNWIGDKGSLTTNSIYSVEISIEYDSKSIMKLQSKTNTNTKNPIRQAWQFGRSVLILQLPPGLLPRTLKTPLTAEELAPIGLLSELVQRIRKRGWEVA